MFDLTRQEKAILVFLSLTFVTGLGIDIYKKSQRKTRLSVAPYEISILQEADRFIEQKRFVNINSFSIEELARLPGVGGKLAQEIVRYHKSHGPFRNKKELMQVKGIGEKKFEQFKDLIIIE